LSIHDISNHIDLTQESCCFKSFVDKPKQDSISSQPLGLDQYQIFENHIDNLTSCHFNELELEYECDSEPQFCDSVSIFESILSHVFVTIWTTFLISIDSYAREIDPSDSHKHPS